LRTAVEVITQHASAGQILSRCLLYSQLQSVRLHKNLMNS